MNKLLNTIGVIILIIGFFSGLFIGSYNGWFIGLVSMVSTIFSAVIYFALAYLIQLVEDNNFYLRHLYNKARSEELKNLSDSRGNSRASLDKIRGYTFKGID